MIICYWPCSVSILQSPQSSGWLAGWLLCTAHGGFGWIFTTSLLFTSFLLSFSPYLLLQSTMTSHEKEWFSGFPYFGPFISTSSRSYQVGPTIDLLGSRGMDGSMNAPPFHLIRLRPLERFRFTDGSPIGGAYWMNGWDRSLYDAATCTVELKRGTLLLFLSASC